MAFASKFPGTCNNCGTRFAVGTMIEYANKRVVGCAACGGNPVDAAAVAANRAAAAPARREQPGFDAAARTSLLARLDPEQRAVAAWTPADGNVRVVAAAGSGKTTTITALVGNLLMDNVVRPHDLIVTTYTRKAADELTERLHRVVSHDLLRGATVNTFHGVALQALRATNGGWPHNRNVDGTGNRAQDVYGGSILWERALGDEQIRGLGVYGVAAPNDAHRDYIMAIECVRADGLRYGTDAAREACEKNGLPNLYAAWGLYEDQKRQQNSYDFADALDAFYELVKDGPGGRIVIVDEAQDNSRLQIALAMALAGETGRVLLVGDVRQSIYEWRGGAPELFLDADKVAGARTLYMTRNYRSGEEIVAMGNRVAAGRTWALGPVAVVGVPERQGEGSITVRGFADAGNAAAAVTSEIVGSLEGEVMTPGDFAILCRTRAQQGGYEAELLAAGVPVAIVGGSSYFASKAWKDYAALLAVATGDADSESIQRAVKREPGAGYWAGRECATALRDQRDPVAAIVAASARVRTTRARTALLGLARWAGDARNAVGTDGKPSFSAVCNRVAERLMAETTEGDGKGDEDNRAAYEVAARLAAAQGTTRAALEFADRCAGRVVNADTVNDTVSRVTISTMHKAKGREWTAVFVDATAGVFPHARCEGNERRMQEEARLFYVAVTRAKRDLHLTYCAEHNGREAGVSEFIADFAPRNEPTPPPARESIPVAPVEIAPAPVAPAPVVERTTAAALRAALVADADRVEALTAAAPAPAPGQRFVPVALDDFDALLSAHGFTLDDELEARTGQRVMACTLHCGGRVVIYTSIPAGDDLARGLGEDSIKVAALNAQGRPVMKRQPYAARTVNWRRTLAARIDTALAALE